MVGVVQKSKKIFINPIMVQQGAVT